MHIRYIAAAAIALLACSPAAHADCSAFYVIAEKQAPQTYRATVVTTDVVLPPGVAKNMAPAQVTEAIYTGSKLYLQIEGKWIARPMTPASQIDQIERRRKSGTTTCSKLADEDVDGEPTSVFTTHDGNPQNTLDVKIWVSKKTNLPIKTETRIDLHPGGQTTTMRLQYGDVHAPPGVN